MPNKRSYELSAVTLTDDLALVLDKSGLAAAGKATLGDVQTRIAGSVTTAVSSALTAIEATAEAIENTAVAVAADAAEATAAATSAETWASAPRGTEIEPGVQSARAYSEITAEYARAIAGAPLRHLRDNSSVDYTHTLDASDKFGAIARWSNDCTEVILPKDWHTTAAVTGQMSLCNVLIYNFSSDEALPLTVPSASATPVSRTYDEAYLYAYNPSTAVDSGPAVTLAYAEYTIPAGNKRKVWVPAFAVYADSTSNTTTNRNTIGLTAALAAGGSLTVTELEAESGPDGYYSRHPNINGKSWVVTLADSETATAIRLTFSLSDKANSLVANVLAVKDCDSVASHSGESRAQATASATHAKAVNGVAGGLIAWSFATQNGLATVNSFTGPAGFDNRRTNVPSTRRSLRDCTIALGVLPTTDTSSKTATMVWSTDKPTACQTACFAPAAGTASVTIVGATSIPANGLALVAATSEGTYYYVRNLA